MNIYSSETGQYALKNSVHWSIDGSFEVCKHTLFAQLWIVYAVTRNGARVPAAYFFLPDKKYTTYRVCLDALTLHGINPPKVLGLLNSSKVVQS